VVDEVNHFGTHCPNRPGIGATYVVRTQTLRYTGLALPNSWNAMEQSKPVAHNAKMLNCELALALSFPKLICAEVLLQCIEHGFQLKVKLLRVIL
jgi:hypothetical protein